MTLAIRPATLADIPAITRIYAHAVDHGTASFELTPPDEAEMTRRMNELMALKFPYLAAELDGGLLFLHAEPLANAMACTPRAHVREPVARGTRGG